MVCLYGTLAPFGDGKAFTLLVLQAAPMKQSPHTAGGLPSALRSCLVLSRHASCVVCISYASRGGMPCQPWPQKVPCGLVRLTQI